MGSHPAIFTSIRFGHLVVDPLEYDLSSCREFLGLRRILEWLTTELVLGIFHPERSKAAGLYEKFLAEDGAAITDPREGAVVDFILGRSDFVEGIKKDYLMARRDAVEIPQLRKLKKISPDKIVAAVSEIFGESSEAIRGKGQSNQWPDWLPLAWRGSSARLAVRSWGPILAR